MKKKNKTVFTDEELNDLLEKVSEACEEPYVVENTDTGDIYITEKWEAYQDSFENKNSLWSTKLKANVKIYPVSELGPSAKLIYGKKDKV